MNGTSSTTIYPNERGKYAETKYSTGKPEIDPNDVEEIIRSRLPLVSNPNKLNYLAYRSSGFATREACNLAEILPRTLALWRREDPVFAEYEAKQLPMHRSRLSRDVLAMEFMRNMRLCLRRDFKVLYKANYNFDGMTEREYDYLRIIRKHYTPQDLIAIDKATEPDEDDQGTTIHTGHVTVVVDGNQIESESARRAAALALLDQFTANQKYLTEPEIEAIDAEYKEINASDS